MFDFQIWERFWEINFQLGRASNLFLKNQENKSFNFGNYLKYKPPENGGFFCLIFKIYTCL